MAMQERCPQWWSVFSVPGRTGTYEVYCRHVLRRTWRCCCPAHRNWPDENCRHIKLVLRNGCLAVGRDGSAGRNRLAAVGVIRLNMETHLDQINVVSILELPYAGEPFPGHDRINHSLGVLETAVTQDWNDWRGALQYMKGVYVIHDQETGQAYVGSACGDTGIWSRLRQYVDYLHGNNVALRELVGQKGPAYARKNLHFALLEFWSMRTADEEVLARESYWKDVLLSRKFGLNKN